MARAFVFVPDNKRYRKALAEMEPVHEAVLARATEIFDAAQADFASHDRPGGHHIGAEEDGVDAIVFMEGPDPLAVEFGHHVHDSDRFVKGLHILGRASGTL